MGVVNDAIENGVGDRRLADHLMPLGDRQLRGDKGRFPAITLFEDFQEIKPLLISEGVRAPIVEDQQLDAGELVDQSWEAAVETGESQIRTAISGAHLSKIKRLTF